MDELRTLSISEVKSFEGFADVSDTEAQRIIETLTELSLLTYQIISKDEGSNSVSTLRKAK